MKKLQCFGEEDILSSEPAILMRMILEGSAYEEGSRIILEGSADELSVD